MRFPPLFLCFVVSAPDGFIRRYRLRPLSEIGKWEGETKQRCENAMTAPRSVSCRALLQDKSFDDRRADGYQSS
jgi:hypothetical protein